MTQKKAVLLLAGTFATYLLIILVIGYANVAIWLQFIRVIATVTALIFFIRIVPVIFKDIPPPRSDWLLFGINWFMAGTVGFSVWNEVSKIFDLDSSVYTSAVSGLFSLMLVIGSVSIAIAPDAMNRFVKIGAVMFAVLFSISLVFVAPLFR